MKPQKPLRAVLTVVGLMTVCAATLLAQPKIEVVGGDTYDWGKVPPGELTTTIEIKNIGDAPLKISRIQPGCGCTAAPIDKDSLAPGEIGKMSVKLDARTRSGALHKIITVYSDDPTAATKVINLKADIKPIMEFRPVQWFVINDAKVGAETAASISIINSSDKPFTISAPELVQGNAKVRFNLKKDQELKPGQEVQITAFVTPAASGAINGMIRMKTTTKEFPSVEFPMYGTVAETAAPKVPAAPAAPKSPDVSSKPGK